MPIRSPAVPVPSILIAETVVVVGCFLRSYNLDRTAVRHHKVFTPTRMFADFPAIEGFLLLGLVPLAWILRRFCILAPLAARLFAYILSLTFVAMVLVPVLDTWQWYRSATKSKGAGT